MSDRLTIEEYVLQSGFTHPHHSDMADRLFSIVYRAITDSVFYQSEASDECEMPVQISSQHWGLSGVYDMRKIADAVIAALSNKDSDIATKTS